MSAERMEKEVEIERFADQGRCIAHIDGRVVFVRFALPGEIDRIVLDEPHDRGGRFWTGEVVDVVRPSRWRVDPVWKPAGPLAQGGGLGGADLIHVSLEGQRAWKKSVIDQQMERLGGVHTDVELHAVPGDAKRGGLHWRTRIEMIAGDDGRPSMRRRDSHDRVAIDAMPLAAREVLDTAEKHHVWDGGFRPGAKIRVAAPAIHEGEEPLGDNYAVSVDGKVVAGNATLVERVSGIGSTGSTLEYEVGANGFWQVHREAPSTLVSHVLDLARRSFGSAPHTMWDLYSGSGLFTVALGAMADKGGTGLMSVEGAPDAVRHARRNAKAAGLGQARIRHGDVCKSLKSVPRRYLHPQLVVLDPPRAGAKRGVCQQLAQARAQTIIYIACNPTSLARDTKTMLSLGYRLASLTAFDIYPMTHHVETVALFQLR